MRKLLCIITLGLFCSCATEPPLPQHTIAYNNVYDVPVKTQLEQRVVVPACISNEDLTRLLNGLYEAAKKTDGYKYSTHPTHVYIYVHEAGVDWRADGYDWLGMVSMIDNEEQGVQLKR
ncbi:MAG: hypothetical protein R2800_09930 [Flavipsychrobacter sp.]